MTITQINALLMVLECGGFTEAGKRLHMTQSAVSQAINALEEELGVVIVVRERRKAIALTAVGERIVSHLRRLAHEVNAVKEIAEQEKQSPLRLLRIGCFPSICACILPQVVRYFETYYPQIKIIPHEANSTEIIESLRQDKIDIGFVHSPVPNMYSLPVYEDKFTVVVPENHPFAQRDSVKLEDLFSEPLITSTGRYELSIMALFKEHNITPEIKYEFNHPATAISFIRQGLGIAQLPELTLKALEHPLRSVPLEPAFYRHISLIANAPPVDDSPLFLLQGCIKKLQADGQI
ncbi:LysR family transcriptional regulator [Klebsiella sp. RHBSTW-00484]|uniref:LysR family transcriptional regulator n=1 Tax=unclassified Klebsiella TaxID=2608929 RepID=UPI0015E55038|nr:MULTISPECIES: LysR family transcriptional regulator [unclassified Klebsiella]QLO36062.1 LysR family transcriptional regulator [Klebsiella sp. RHBSTW-00484]QLT75579.1 LysR family transcriptional regulator [Klebsiella sp. RHBSTW-00464]